MSLSNGVSHGTLSLEDAIRQNPAAVAPREIIDKLCLITVRYTGFDTKIHKGHIVMHQDVREDVEAFFTQAMSLSFPIEKVVPIADKKYAWDDFKSCNDNNTAGFNYRTISNTTKLSKHATGHAFDINPVQNIYVKYNAQGEETFRAPERGVYDPTVPGTLTANHPLVVCMKERGWVWGGDWTPESGRVDYQHFEK